MMVRKVKAPDTQDELVNAFRVFDYEENGFISAQQLCHVMTNIGEKLSQAEITEMLKQAGVDSHGQINYEGNAAITLFRIGGVFHKHYIRVSIAKNCGVFCPNSKS